MGYVITSDCTACGACLLTCPEHAIVASLPLLVRNDRCTSCGECVEICPADAVLEVSAADPSRPPAFVPPSFVPPSFGAGEGAGCTSAGCTGVDAGAGAGAA